MTEHDVSKDGGELLAFKRNERTRAGMGARAAKVALENAHRRDMERAGMFQRAVGRALEQRRVGTITADEALLDITIAYAEAVMAT